VAPSALSGQLHPPRFLQVLSVLSAQAHLAGPSALSGQLPQHKAVAPADMAPADSMHSGVEHNPAVRCYNPRRILEDLPERFATPKDSVL